MAEQSWRWLIVVLVWFGSQVTVRSEELGALRNGGLEGPFTAGLAQGWESNCYGDNQAEFAEETQDVHGGKAAERITCRRFVTGGVQIRLPGVAVEKGQPYTLLVWMKGEVASPVYVGIRQHGEPYTGYLKRYVRVRNGWRPFLITGAASDSDPSCGIYIMFAGTGTLWLDDVSLRPGIHDEVSVDAGLPPRKGNRVYNSGFEAGPEGWTPVGRFSLASAAVHSGRYSAKVETAGIESRPFPVRTGQRYTLTAYLKAVHPGTQVEVKLMEWADNGGDSPSVRPQRSATVTATTEWSRCQISGTAMPDLWEDYLVRLVPSDTVYLDDVQVEEGEATAYQPAETIEVGATTPTRCCSLGDRVEVTALVASAQPLPSVSLRYTLEDLWSRPQQTVEHTAVPGVPDQATFACDGLGMYRVRVQANESPATGEVCWGVFPRRDRQPRPQSAFGTHVTATSPEPTHTLLASGAMGARWVRLHDFGDFCHWRMVEPEPGRWVWYDAEVGALQAQGYVVLANLGHPPLWAGRADARRTEYGDWTNAPPRDVAEWEDYVFRTVEHYRDTIHHWEVWNEPYGQAFFAGTPEEYAALLAVAARAAKRADPRAVVVGGCFSPYSPEWTQRVLAQGALEVMDVLSYHEYWSPGMAEAPTPGEAPLLALHAGQYVDTLRERGRSKPLFMTEGGIACPPFASWLPAEGFGSTALEAAQACTKGMVEMLSAGVSTICYYYTGGQQGAMPWFSAMANGHYVLLDYDGRPKPTMMAYSALELLLDGARPLRVLRSADQTLHLFGKGQGSLAVLWSRRAREVALPGLSPRDLMGNALQPPHLGAGEVAYVEAPQLTPAQLAAALGESPR